MFFVRTFNAWMILAKKGHMENIDATKAPSEDDTSAAMWKVNDTE